ncbi:MAG: chromate efflux transporter [Nocardioides sp.]
MSTGPVRDLVPLREATRTWFAISLQTFGGPAGQIAVMQRTLVDEKRWLGERRFLHALSYCMLLPGPEAQQLAIYTGWLLNGWIGGFIAGTLFVLPGLLALLALSWAYVAHGDTALVTGLFVGLAPAVLAIVVQAVIRLSRRALWHPVLQGIAIAAFAGLALLGIPFPIVIAVAGLAGWVAARGVPQLGHLPGPAAGAADAAAPVIADDALHLALPTWRRNAALLVGGLALWLAPVGAAAVLVGRDSVLVDQGTFFAGTALVTFGGAYAVLAFVAQQAVHTFGWLSGAEMIKGLALAETTPGPLIMVVQFVAFVGAYRHPGGLDPWVAAVLGSLLTVWVTFVPCYFFIFLGAPYVERLRSNRTLAAALAGITAAVVGVIANLAIFFALHTLFTRTQTVAAGPVVVDLPVLTSADPTAWVIAAVALALIFVRGWSPLRTLGVCALLGLGATLVG